jgi:hypothetical protein
MTKITIEVDGSTVQSVQPSGAASATPGPTSQQQESAPADIGNSLSALLERAASMGALNAGPGPSLSSDGSVSVAPIAHSIGGSNATSQQVGLSAGPASANFSGSQGGSQ